MLIDIAKRTRLAERLRAAWRAAVQEETKTLRAEVRRLTRAVERLSATLADAAERAARGDQVASQVRHILESNDRDRRRIEQLGSLLDEGRIAAHVREAVAAAIVNCDPYPHIVVERLL